MALLTVALLTACEGELPMQESEMMTHQQFAESLGYDSPVEKRYFPINAYRTRYGDIGEIHMSEAAEKFEGFTHRKVTTHQMPETGETYANWYLFYPVRPDGIVLVVTFNPDGTVRHLRKALEGQRFPKEPAWEKVEPATGPATGAASGAGAVQSATGATAGGMPATPPVPGGTASSPAGN